jgi:hypothetical protein
MALDAVDAHRSPGTMAHAQATLVPGVLRQLPPARFDWMGVAR